MTEDVDPSDLKFVGPATASVIAAADFTASDVRERSVSFEMLREAGVNPGVAARIRREHSLPWSFETESGTDLERRSDQIRGLGEAEREWVAASSGDWETGDGDADATDDANAAGDTDADDTASAGTASGWTPSVAVDDTDAAEADGSGDPVAAESAWRERSPTAVSELDGIDAETERRLAAAGVTSVRSLAVADTAAVADALDLDADRLADLQRAARDRQ